MTNKDVAAQLEEIGTLMRLAGHNEFRAIAFDKAARTIETMDEAIVDFHRAGTLTSIKGIGQSIANDISSYIETGTISVLEELRASIPKGLLAWLSISGLGPKNIFKIHQALGITELEELKQKCEDGSVAALPGLGQKSADKILKSIAWMQQFGERCRMDEADAIAQHFVDSLQQHHGIQALSLAGSLRRNMETIGDIDILIAADPSIATEVFEQFISDEWVTEVLGKGETKSSVRTKQGRQVDVRIVNEHAYPAALLYFTGSKEHNVFLRQRARDRGMALNEYGLFKLTTSGETDFSQRIEAPTEAAIYQHLGLHFIPPELREDQGELTWFEQNAAENLIEQHDIKGVLHAHSTWSDGAFSIKTMALACHERGYTYLGITDHSRSAAYAGGLTIERVKEQWKEIDALNAWLREEGISFTVFKGIESDILADGNLDYPDDILAGFDFVIASVHSSLDMEPSKMLERFQKAASHPFTTIIGHPTGRLLLKREGNPFDLKALIRFAAEQNTVIEINASPWRLDLDWRYGKTLREAGLRTAVCPDAHDTDGIDDIQYGVGIARKMRLGASSVLNTMSADQFKHWLATPKSSRT